MESKTIWLAVACLLVGGFAGYWYAGQAAATEDEYLQKNIHLACQRVCGGPCGTCLGYRPGEEPSVPEGIKIVEDEVTVGCSAKPFYKGDNGYIVEATGCHVMEGVPGSGAEAEPGGGAEAEETPQGMMD